MQKEVIALWRESVGSLLVKERSVCCLKAAGSDD